MSRPVRIGNCSGFFGDRLSAAKEMVEGGPLDVLTGDYLAELTMFILWRTRERSGGYARSFLAQAEHILGTCQDRGIRVVTNAGGLNPAGLADALRTLTCRLGLPTTIAHIEGDDLLARLPELQATGHELAHLDTGRPLAGSGADPVTANAYLGGWGIAAALGAGADVVVCPRVTDAALVVGPAAWWHGWAREDWDPLAGAVAAGHVIECGTQATGGNYSSFTEIDDLINPGFPIAEVAADGSSVITKHPGTAGAVTVGTVTAQLLYEIDRPAYLNPDVTAHFDTTRLTQEATDRVALSGTVGSPPPPTTKVCLNYLGGYRADATFVLTGLDIDAKADLVLRGLTAKLDPAVELHPRATELADGGRHLTVTAKSPDRAALDRRFFDSVMELALAGYPGFHLTDLPPASASAYGVYWPTLVPSELVDQEIVAADGTRTTIPATPAGPVRHTPTADGPTAADLGETRPAPLGLVADARSGDKGGNANAGLWVRSPDAYRWLAGYLTADRLRELLPEAADLVIRRHELPNLYALNFVVVGLLGEGVASSTRADPQAKSLGEWLRGRTVPIPVSLLKEG
jgi:hypothetical protein